MDWEEMREHMRGTGGMVHSMDWAGGGWLLVAVVVMVLVVLFAAVAAVVGLTRQGH
ncbi:MAG TPA: hypothetical protein VGK60_03020 [Pedococcus sp.]|jgi:hypothetical protein